MADTRELFLGEGATAAGGGSQHLYVNMGPAHPAMHGIVRIFAELDGETVVKTDVEIGYLHRAFEKDCEAGPYNNAIPYTDRLNYVSPLINNFGYSSAIEKLLGIEITDRCKYIRVIMSEISRICDHLTCVGAASMELGAFTPFLWMVKARDLIWDVMEEETGARLTHSFGRVGGMAKPPTEGFKEHVRAVTAQILSILAEVERLLFGNRIFLDRLEGVGPISAEDAISLGWTGPCLRAAGVPYDVRKAHPYLKYGEVEFDVPVGKNSDCLDRFLVRIEEMKQSVHIITQCLERMPEQGAINVDDPRVILPEKQEVYSTIEATIQHFKIVMEGLKLPAGEVYSYSEGGNGELGFYLVSDGSGTPYRVRIRPPCFLVTAGLERIITGQMVADVVPCFGSLNMIGGECDR